MKAYWKIVPGLLILMACGCGWESSTAQNDLLNSDRMKVAKSAESWLELVDAGDFGASWDGTANIFQTTVSKQDWEKALQTVRAPLGGLISRERTSLKELNNVPSVGSGKVLTFRYDSVFDQGGETIEILSIGLEDKGEWRVVGYQVQ